VAVTALVVSILALLLAATSLGWQVYSWRRTGPAVKVTVDNAIPVGIPGVPDHLLQVTATNHGRGPTTVMGWGFQLPNNNVLAVPQQTPMSTPLPRRLEGGAEASWFMDPQEIRLRSAELRIPFDRIIGYVTLAGGEKVLAKRGVPLA
jgi:hypothetical protein